VTTEVHANRYAERLNTVEGKMDDLETHFRVITERTDETTRSLARMEAKLDQQFKDVGHDLMVLEVDLGKLTKRTDALDQKTDVLGQKIDALDTKIDALDTKIDVLDTKIDALDTKLTVRTDALDHKIDALDTKLTGKIDALDTKLTGKIDALSTELARIATHLSVAGPPPPAGHP
jgi:chromosome segregation ATPase